jgi:2-polyprenyl-3-methyl-5-hydroxy-6-metoxy-1,4-benzoquinol methylase
MADSQWQRRSGSMRAVCCDLCGQDNAIEFAVINNARIVRCCSCGLVYVNPRPDVCDLALSYEKYYGDGQSLAAASSWNVGSQHAFAGTLRLIRTYHSSGKLLDIGCGGGFFLDMARRYGYEPYGIELDKDACDFAADKFGLNVFHGHLANANFAENLFEVITILNVLEHVDSPRDMLGEVLRVLKPTGLVVLVVPNLVFGLPLLRLYTLASKFHKTYDIWHVSVFAVPTHLYLFTPETLRALLIKSGFDCIRITNAIPVDNPGLPIKTVLKRLIYYSASAVTKLSGRALVLSYSMIATAIKPQAQETIAGG